MRCVPRACRQENGRLSHSVNMDTGECLRLFKLPFDRALD